MTRARFLVTLDLPPRVSPEQMAAYIEQEVKCGVGQMMPEDPIFALDRDSVRVQPVVFDNTSKPAFSRESSQTDEEYYSQWLERLSRSIQESWRPVSQLPPHVFVSRLVVLRHAVVTDGGGWTYTTAVSTADGWLTPAGTPPHPDCEFKEMDVVSLAPSTGEKT